MNSALAYHWKAIRKGKAHIMSTFETAIDLLQARLSQANYAEFTRCRDEWQQGKLSAYGFHEALVRLGLLDQVSTLVAACANSTRRNQLLSVHQAAIASGVLLIFLCTFDVSWPLI
jgi:hypothetical protein